ncbi:MAG TPA: amino acid adenylation domain-containing protein, partial [Chitinispirillaceae bacterium]|nr:amino acid adenylation domain-containing protein [Chitinispirillaceae bacterium]
YCLSENDRFLQFAIFSFDASVEEIFGALCSGCTLVLRNDNCLSSTSNFWEFCKEFNISVIDIPTRFWQILSNDSTDLIPDNVRLIIIGGEAVDSNSLSKWFNRVAYTPKLINTYGPTETTVISTIQFLNHNSSSWLSIGKPIDNTKIYILDTFLQPVPTGVKGELYIGGVGVARGYLNRPELTEERFLTDPFSAEPDARMYKTGDLGRWLPDGTIEFLGRNDFQVKIRGFRIELGEIESKLQSHSDIREAVVLAREDEPGEKRLVTYYTSSKALNAETLREYLRGLLPDYMIPSAYVRLESLPLNPHGKLDRNALPAPKEDAYITSVYEAPVGDIEKNIANIWSDLLKVERVGRYDNFFELGGHSLLVVQVGSRIRQKLGFEVTINDLFARPVLADLALKLSEAVKSDLSIIEQVERSEKLPLSFAQQRLWFLSQMEDVSKAYYITGGLRLRGDLNKTALRSALDQIVFRHETLRTTFALVNGEPVQRIASKEESCFCLLEKTIENPQQLSKIIEEEVSNPFDLERGPLVRGLLIQEKSDNHVLYVMMHHIISDGWSMGILVKEFYELYNASLTGDDKSLPELKVQYADYSVWQRSWFSGQRLSKQAQYWKATLNNVPELLELPTDHPRPAQQSYTGNVLSVKIDKYLTKRLKDLSQRNETTLFMTLLAGWAVLLSRLSGQKDIIIGTPSANRGRREIEDLIGFFVNTLALRFDLSGLLNTGKLLAHVKERTLEAQSNQDIPFEQVVEIVNPVRSLAHSPLFQIMFAWQNHEKATQKIMNLKIEPFEEIAHSTSQFDLTLSLGETDDTITGGLEYATSLFERETVERIISYYLVLLDGMATEESLPVDRLPLLPETERKQILESWNATETPFPEEKCIHELFEEQVELTPQAVALVHGGQSLTYSDLNAWANRLAHYLRSLGVGPDNRVAICIERSMEMVVAILGVLKAGGAYVPLDPNYPAERLKFMLIDSEPVVVLTNKELFFNLFDDFSSQTKIIDLSDKFTSQPEVNICKHENGLTSQNLAYVIYTSGSTGKPKGVMIEHRGVCNLVLAQIKGFKILDTSRVLQFASFSFDACVSEIFTALCKGASLFISEKGLLLADKNLIQAIQNNNITHCTLTPAVLSSMYHQSKLSSLKTLIVAGDMVSEEIYKKWSDGCVFINAYGPTETTVCATMNACSNDKKGAPSIGKPIDNTEIYILDTFLQPVPTGVKGELYIGGVGVARGYLNRPELTEERFLTDPFSAEPDARMYKTGDLGRWLPDG